MNIWDELSKVYNMPGIPDEAMSIIGDVMLAWSETQEGDTISRKAAIDALDVLCQEHRYKIPGKEETYSQYNEAWQDALDRAEGAIFNLPSTQPSFSQPHENDHFAEYSKKVVPCEDVVSRQAAIDAIEETDWYHQNRNKDMVHGANSQEDQPWYKADDIYQALTALPSVIPKQPDIIRCKDCMNNGRYDTDCPIGWSGKEYCSFAERREEGEQDD